jgi:hypothetical protein
MRVEPFFLAAVDQLYELAIAAEDERAHQGNNDFDGHRLIPVKRRRTISRNSPNE